MIVKIIKDMKIHIQIWGDYMQNQILEPQKIFFLEIFVKKKKTSEIRMSYKVNNSIIQMIITSFYNCMMAM